MSSISKKHKMAGGWYGAPAPLHPSIPVLTQCRATLPLLTVSNRPRLFDAFCDQSQELEILSFFPPLTWLGSHLFSWIIETTFLGSKQVNFNYPFWLHFDLGLRLVFETRPPHKSTPHLHVFSRVPRDYISITRRLYPGLYVGLCYFFFICM